MLGNGRREIIFFLPAFADIATCGVFSRDVGIAPTGIIKDDIGMSFLAKSQLTFAEHSPGIQSAFTFACKVLRIRHTLDIPYRMCGISHSFKKRGLNQKISRTHAGMRG
jgi:hypothetical protein